MMIWRIEGYLLIPHELLHVIGYWLVGKRCTYRWGDRQVKPAGRLTRREQLVGLLFPFVTCVAVWFILLLMAAMAWVSAGLTWSIILTLLTGIILVYAFVSIGDLRQAYLLLQGRDLYEKTPFDFLFWPVLTDHIEGLHRSSLVILVCLIVLYTIYLWL